MKKKELVIDTLGGGNGDIWMRLVGFYTFAELVPETKIIVLVPAFLKKLAHFTFGDRLAILEEISGFKIDLRYTTLGLKDLLKDLVRGNRFISPYQRAVIHDKRQKNLKDWVNEALFSFTDFLGLILVPNSIFIPFYQSYLEVVGIKSFKKISYKSFVVQLEKDYQTIYQKLNGDVPISPELDIPLDLEHNILVFPTGTSRQFVPVSWACKNLPNAYYAFFSKDKEANNFEKNGLKTIAFHKEPGDIIRLAQRAKWTISTDSFPSHLLQYSREKCTITITEVLRSRIISPVFKGRVIDSVTSCHPCLHLDRNNHPLCAAGYSSCKNWESAVYTSNILSSAQS